MKKLSSITIVKVTMEWRGQGVIGDVKVEEDITNE